MKYSTVSRLFIHPVYYKRLIFLYNAINDIPVILDSEFFIN